MLVVTAGGSVYRRKPDRQVQASEGVSFGRCRLQCSLQQAALFSNDLRGVRLGDQVGDGIGAFRLAAVSIRRRVSGGSQFVVWCSWFGFAAS